MTSVIVWQRHEIVTTFGNKDIWQGDYWIAADSRISAPSDEHVSGRRLLTDGAAKVIPIHYRLFRRYESGPGLSECWEGLIGFAYAGNTLPATMTYAYVVSSFVEMTADHFDELPTMSDFVDFIARVGQRYAVETRAPFELLITGNDPRSNARDVELWHVAVWSNGRPPSVRAVRFDASSRFFLMGNRQDEISKIVQAGFDADPEYNPTAALGDIIDRHEVAEIGGSLQLARLHRSGGITLFPSFGAAAYGGKLPTTFKADEFGGVGAFKVGLRRGY